MLLTFSSQISDIVEIVLNLLRRWKDRSFSLRISRDGNDIPKTKCIRQKELHSLYTGPQIKIGYKFAYMFTFIFVCLAYSSVMPLLYLIGSFYFFVAIIFEKTYLFRFYQKTKEFDHNLPLKSHKYFKYAIILHMIMRVLFFCLSDILEPEFT